MKLATMLVVLIISDFPRITKPEAPVRASGLERKKELSDMELSRLLRKPGKQNGAGFF